MKRGPNQTSYYFQNILKKACRADDHNFERLFAQVTQQIIQTPDCILKLDYYENTTLSNILFYFSQYNKAADQEKLKAEKRTLKVLELIFSAKISNADFEWLLGKRGKKGIMPLNSILQTDSTKIVFFLFEQLDKYPDILEKNINNRTDDGYMPLDSALQSRSEEIVEFLFKRLQEYPNVLKANLSNVTNNGLMPINAAAYSGCDRMLALLFKHLDPYPEILYENLNNRTNEGFRILHCVLNSGSEKMTELLFEYLRKDQEILKRNLSNRTNEKFRPLHCALRSGSNEKITLLFKYLDLDQNLLEDNLKNRTNCGHTPLDFAIETGSLEIVELLYSRLNKYKKILKDSLENRTKEGFSPLDLAILSGSTKVVERLLGWLENLKMLEGSLRNRTNEGYMPLNAALRSGAKDLITLLFDALKEYPQILEINLRNLTNGRLTVLSHSLRSGNKEIVEDLLKYLKESGLLQDILNNRTHDGFMVLDDALNSGSWPCVQLILDELVQHPLVLHKHLVNRTQEHFTILHDLSKHIKDSNCIESLISLCEKHLSKEELKKLLVARTNKNYSVLDAFMKYGNAASLKCYLRSLSLAFKDAKGALVSLFRFKYDSGSLEYEEMYRLIQEAALYGKFPIVSSNEHQHALIARPYFPHLCSLTKKKEDCAVLDPIEVPIVTPFAGIGNKYLAQMWLEPPRENGVQGSSLDKNKHHILICIDHFIADLTKVKIFQFTHPYLEASFYTQRGPITPEQMVTFICAGRKENALLVQPKGGRCVIVLAKEEWDQKLDKNQKAKMLGKGDVLILKRIKSPIFGEFAPHLIMSRRIAIFLTAHIWKLNHFIMLDDNIQQVDFKDDSAISNSWDALYQLLLKQLGREPCVTISRDSLPPPKPGQLGSKLFMINFKKIVEKLKNEAALFFLFPSGQREGIWGEDYYLQIMLYQLFLGEAQGFRIINHEMATFHQFHKHFNAFLFSLNKNKRTLVEPLQPLNVDLAGQIDPLTLKRINATIALLNNIIDQNKVRFELQQVYLQNHPTPFLPSLNLPPRSFIKDLREELTKLCRKDDKLRPYQKRALEDLGKATSQFCQIMMATGTGKTRVQAEVAVCAYQHLHEGECVALVTANISLVSQLTQDFENLCEDSIVPLKEIFPISSAYVHKPIDAILYDMKVVAKTKKVFIFCIDSFINLLIKHPPFLSYVRLLAFDECHAYATPVEDIIEKAKAHLDLLIVGLTATPALNTSLTPVFTYTHQQAVKEGYLAPVIVDSLKMNYSNVNVERLIKNLPSILVKTYHPGYKDKSTLMSTKGIIYLPSIEACNKAQVILEENGIKCYVIHSQKARCDAQVREFKQKPQGILLACGMCQLGFDDPMLAFAIIAKNVKNENKLKQILGRVMRKDEDKMGYILTFDEICVNIKKFLTDQPFIYPLDPDYLGQDFEEEENEERPSKLPPISIVKEHAERFSEEPHELLFREWFGEEACEEIALNNKTFLNAWHHLYWSAPKMIASIEETLQDEPLQKKERQVSRSALSTLNIRKV